MDKDILVQNIKKHCAIKGVKPTVACRESGAGPNVINHLETRGSIPSVEKIHLLATYLGVTTSELLGEDLPGAADLDSFTRAMQQEAYGLTEADKALLLSMAQQLNSARKGTVDNET